MSIEITVPEYSVFTQALQQQGVGLTPAEMHGLISGILCGGNQNDNWRTMVHDLTNEGEAFSQSLAQPLQAVYQHTRDTLEDDGFGFQLLLPDGDDVTVFDRADALSGWVNHFLLGLGMMQKNLGKVKGEVGEVIDDLRSIAQLGYEEDEDQEELEQSLEEVAEYVRMAAMLCHSEFSQEKPNAAEVQKPTLH
ncbi:Putative conserved exported protein precursor [Enterobacteriaceae bacterium bta3-1]|nr:Putative conserved exported protein precursor [Enterobacteriaceae bacterium bta3-1]